MASMERAKTAVNDLERSAPQVYEGLYGAFLENFMDSDKSNWTIHCSRYLKSANGDWAEMSREMAALLWERFEQRISC